jgi:outer membrane protein assembly factor BamB
MLYRLSNTTMPKRRPLLALALANWASFAYASLTDALGAKPSYLRTGINTVPNQQAILKTIWAPGLDDGYVPQGLTYLPNAVLVSGYQSTDTKVNKGPCRVFSVATDTGQLRGYFDLPVDCGHAGGLTMINDSELVVADHRTLYKINLAQALASKNTGTALISVVKLGGALKGSFVDFDGKDLWIGTYDKDATLCKAYRLSLEIFDRFNRRLAVKDDAALSALSIPAECNGMAFDASGALWLASSSSKFGALYRLNAKTGEVTARYNMVSGLEDLSFDERGNLWAVSEAGSQRWSTWATTFPLIFQVDVSALK